MLFLSPRAGSCARVRDLLHRASYSCALFSMYWYFLSASAPQAGRCTQAGMQCIHTCIKRHASTTNGSVKPRPLAGLPIYYQSTPNTLPLFPSPPRSTPRPRADPELPPPPPPRPTPALAAATPASRAPSAWTAPAWTAGAGAAAGTAGGPRCRSAGAPRCRPPPRRARSGTGGAAPASASALAAAGWCYRCLRWWAAGLGLGERRCLG